MNSIYYEKPNSAIQQWLKDEYVDNNIPDPEDNSTYWDRVVNALENCSASDFDKTNLTYQGTDKLLNSLQRDLCTKVKYKTYQDNYHAVNTDWVNIGFNASIPEYVKYRRKAGLGWNHIWLKSTVLSTELSTYTPEGSTEETTIEISGNILTPISVGALAYKKSYDSVNTENIYTEVAGETVTKINDDDRFYYGNNHGTYYDGSEYDARFAVPTTITTNKGTYDFCGYNMTLNTSECINIENNIYLMFGGVVNKSGTNVWSESLLRKWINSKTVVDGMYVYNNNNCKGLVYRILEEEGFLKNIVNTVNRIYVIDNYKTGKILDENQCEHVVDRFWILGNGNVNALDIYVKSTTSNEKWNNNFRYDTFFYPKITNDTLYIPNTATRRKRYMNINGIQSDVSNCWLHSAVVSGDNMAINAAFIDGDGRVRRDIIVYSSNSAGVSPACLIG